MNEFSIIKKYLSPLTKGHKGTFNLGDDIYYDHEKRLAISIDTYNQGTHFINFKELNSSCDTVYTGSDETPFWTYHLSEAKSDK